MSNSAAGRPWTMAGVLCGLVVVADQVSKAVVEAQIAVGEAIDVFGPLQLTLSHNRGVAFGLADGVGVLLVLITIIALGVVMYLFSRRPNRPGLWIAVGLIGGGALGNLTDR